MKKVSSIGDLRVYAAQWTGYDRKIVMLIRIRRLNKRPSPHKETERTGFITPSMRYLEASYADRKQDTRILYGSI